MFFKITDNTKRYLLGEARREIAESLGITFTHSTTAGEEADAEYGAFVTLHKNGRLRGCIGYILGDGKLSDSVRRLAIEAAFSDTRFRPLTEAEYPEIDIEITVLSPLIETTPPEVTVGRDGLFVIQGAKRGVLLPQVATEYKWGAETFLSQTCVKAGLSPDAWKNNTIKIYRFEGIIFSERDTL